MASTKPVFKDVQEPRNLRGLSLSTTDSSLATQSSVTIAAGSEGVRHVADSFSFSVAANGGAVLTASTVRVSVIDGATAGTNYLWTDVLHIDSNGVEAISYFNMGLTGTAATALTVEFDGAVTGAWTSLNLGYFDVGP
tara:strand:- start:107 stop:520 length:414 start_codon:yes stop_codon:yes gene_type:complete